MPVAGVQNINKQLDAKVGQRRCSPEGIGSCATAGKSGGRGVDVCAPKGKKLCVEYPRLANYVARLDSTCVKVGKVSGTQNIVEVPGLKVEI